MGCFVLAPLASPRLMDRQRAQKRRLSGYRLSSGEVGERRVRAPLSPDGESSASSDVDTTEDTDDRAAERPDLVAQYRSQMAILYDKRMEVLIETKEKEKMAKAAVAVAAAAFKAAAARVAAAAVISSDTEEEAAGVSDAEEGVEVQHVDDQVLAWLHQAPPRNMSRKLRDMLAEVRALPRHELPWVGEMVCRAARVAAMNHGPQRAE